jgi:ADP-ribose pyrophosphatase
VSGRAAGGCAIFLAGSLADSGLRRIIFGRDIIGTTAALSDHQLGLDPASGLTLVVHAGTGSVEGQLFQTISQSDKDRLAFYGAVVGAVEAMVTIDDGTSSTSAMTLLSKDMSGLQVPDPMAWNEGWGEIVRATAWDVMAEFPVGDVARLNSRLGQMMVRGASRVRAGQSAPTTVRFRAKPQDIRIQWRDTPYAAFFALEEYEVGWRLFAGNIGEPAKRAVFISGDAVTVLPYDPVRDRVLLIEQFRAGPMARGDCQPWLLEPVAGRIDPGETPEGAARREATEEAGLTLGSLLKVAEYYPTPGAKSEYLYSYVALCDLPDDITGVFGLASEAEDIRSHLVSFDELMGLVASGEAANAPLILTALWLQRERDRLRL